MRVFHRLAVLVRSWLRAAAIDSEFQDEIQLSSQPLAATFRPAEGPQ
jgi:hypothetical protein